MGWIPGCIRLAQLSPRLSLPLPQAKLGLHKEGKGGFEVHHGLAKYGLRGSGGDVDEGLGVDPSAEVGKGVDALDVGVALFFGAQEVTPEDMAAQWCCARRRLRPSRQEAHVVIFVHHS